MGTAEWIMLAALLAIGAAGAVWWRAWKQPRLLILIGLLIAVGFGMGTVIGLVFAGIDSISPSAFWVVCLAMIAVEGYRWQRRRRNRT